MLFIPILLGTARVGRQSEKVAKFVLEEVKRYGRFETKLIDARSFGLPATDDTKTSEVAKKFSTTMTRADGLIVVSPEYNHGMPGELKMTLDQLYREYKHKPIGICGVSEGHMGGARMVEQLRLVSIELQMVPIEKAVYFSNVENIFEKDFLGKKKII
ncbi:MAG: NAD(P)H-dependent oxidoreductase, partial [Patescibacteria group bacterium]